MGIRRRQGGKGETGEKALIRECREELAVEVSVGKIYCEVTQVYPDLTVRLTLFDAEIVRGEPTLLEHEAMAWIAPEEAARVASLLEQEMKHAADLAVELEIGMKTGKSWFETK